jgi:hypothetical protein
MSSDTEWVLAFRSRDAEVTEYVALAHRYEVRFTRYWGREKRGGGRGERNLSEQNAMPNNQLDIQQRST